MELQLIKIGSEEYPINVLFKTHEAITNRYNLIYYPKAVLEARKKQKKFLVEEELIFMRQQRAFSELEKLYNKVENHTRESREAFSRAKKSFQQSEKRWQEAKKREFKPIIDDRFFFWAYFQLLMKTGFWPFRKPFRSVRHLMRHITYEEATVMIAVIGAVLNGRNIENVAGVKKKTVN
jgi:hypothetical protein